MKDFPSAGFTIVEILVVIVVIGILAATSTVAYRDVQGRANDNVIRTDLKNIARQIEIMRSASGSYNSGGTMRDATNSTTNISVSKESYRATADNNNLIYCATSDRTTYGIAALSKSGSAYMYTPTGGLQDYPAAWTSVSTDTCPNLVGASYTFSWGYGRTDGWKEWATPNP